MIKINHVYHFNYGLDQLAIYFLMMYAMDETPTLPTIPRISLR